MLEIILRMYGDCDYKADLATSAIFWTCYLIQTRLSLAAHSAIIDCKRSLLFIDQSESRIYFLVAQRRTSTSISDFDELPVKYEFHRKRKAMFAGIRSRLSNASEKPT